MPSHTYFVWDHRIQKWQYLGSNTHARLEQVLSRRLGRCTLTVNHLRGSK